MRARFGPFTIDSETRQLQREGRDIHLSPKAFDLLATLVGQRPRVVEKAALHAEIWPDTHVVEANLNVLIGEIRKAIGDNPRDAAFIRTVHGVGYAFSGQAVDIAAASAPNRALLSWVVWQEKTFSLAEGDNVIGRDPRSSVWVDADGVSRRHALIRIDTANRRVTLSDLGSTNGTLLNGDEIRGEVALNDRDRIGIGTVDLTIRLWASETAPATKRIRRRRG